MFPVSQYQFVSPFALYAALLCISYSQPGATGHRVQSFDVHRILDVLRQLTTSVTQFDFPFARYSRKAHRTGVSNILKLTSDALADEPSAARRCEGMLYFIPTEPLLSRASKIAVCVYSNPHPPIGRVVSLSIVPLVPLSTLSLSLYLPHPTASAGMYQIQMRFCVCIDSQGRSTR